MGGLEDSGEGRRKPPWNTSLTPSLQPAEVLLWRPALAFPHVGFSVSQIPKLLPLTLGERVTQAEVLTVRKFSPLTF